MEVACVLQSIIMAITKIQRICLINQKSKFCLLVYILQSLQVNIYRPISTITIHYLVAGEKNSCFSLELKDATSFDHTSKLNHGHLGDCGKYSTPLKKKWGVFFQSLVIGTHHPVSTALWIIQVYRVMIHFSPGGFTCTVVCYNILQWGISTRAAAFSPSLPQESKWPLGLALEVRLLLYTFSHLLFQHNFSYFM